MTFLKALGQALLEIIGILVLVDIVHVAIRFDPWDGLGLFGLMGFALVAACYCKLKIEERASNPDSTS